MKTEIGSISIINESNVANGKVVKKSGTRIGKYYVFLKSYKESVKNDVVKCFYMRSLIDFGFCVIKEGSKGETLDKYGRDICDRLKWQEVLHKDLGGEIRLPRYIHGFEQDGNYYLAIQHIRGKSLYQLIRKEKTNLNAAFASGHKLARKYMAFYLQIVELISSLHAQKIVHRDANPNNFMVNFFNKVYAIDVELSYKIGDTLNPQPPFQLGSYGYMSPEQKALQTPTCEDDFFALGSILFNIITGIHPLKLIEINVADTYRKLAFFMPDEGIRQIMMEAFGEVSKRPCPQVIKGVVTAYENRLKTKHLQTAREYHHYMPQANLKQTIQQVIASHSIPLLADPQKGWFSENRNASPNTDKGNINKVWFASFGHGASGVLYVLAKAYRLGYSLEGNEAPIQHSLRNIETRYINRINKVNASLINGSAGIAVALHEARCMPTIAESHLPALWIPQLLSRQSEQVHFSEGITGIGEALLLCKEYFDESSWLNRLENCIDLIVSKQEDDGSWLFIQQGAPPRKSKGYYNGLSGIVQFLIKSGIHIKNERALQAAEKGLAWLEKKAIKRGDKLVWTSSKGKQLSYGLHDGNAGIVKAFLMAFEYWNDSRFIKIIEKSLSTEPVKLYDDNLCHSDGLAGLGEVYLEAFRLLKNEQWKERADWVSQFIYHLTKITRTENHYWLVGSERQPVADFLTGNSGVLHFLLRYCHQADISFPLC